ncbi:MAG: hypothetical protein B6244_10705 [Candidatus Cloacimonetes bacterium 4572_55]|nr:MAG: hypothetical protein B6244_10705 [Candidatus Cloacimonetes bacterium 4572_55]
MNIRFLYSIFFLFNLTIIGTIIGCQPSSQSEFQADPNKQKDYANELLNNALYQQAIDEFSRYLQHSYLDDKVRANINYIIATTYLERLRDYENAMAYFIKVKTYYPDSQLTNQVNKGIVACLERLNRSADARQTLSEATALDPDQKDRPNLPGRVVAEVGEKKITQGDLDAEINRLPPLLRQEYQKPDKKLQFLQQMIATELMYSKAQRMGFEKDKEIIDQIFQAKKSILVQKLIQGEISEKINVTDFDIKLYYDANKSQYLVKDEEGNERQATLEEVKTRVRSDVQSQREQDAYQQLVQQLLTANDVKLYSDLVASEMEK